MDFGLLATSFEFPVVHDWVLTWDDRSFGIRQKSYGLLGERFPDVFKPTEILFGSHVFQTKWPAYLCLTVAVLALLLIVAAVALLISRVPRRQPG